MSKIGESAPKSPAVFGVTSLLAAGSVVYYENLFTTRCLGRVSDLLAAQLRREGLDELKFRAVLLFSVFEAYRNEAAEGETLARPLVLECGTDAEKIALGVSFRRLMVKDPATVEGLGERIASGVPRDAFEALLRELYMQSDRMVLRFATDVGRFEVISILSLKTKNSEKPKPEVIRIGAGESAAAAGRAAGRADDAYIQLADLDYLSQLNEPTSMQVKSESPLGALIAKVAQSREQSVDPVILRGGSESAGDEKRVVRGIVEVIAQEANTVHGTPDYAEQDKTVVGGVTDVTPPQKTVISGTREVLRDDKAVIVSDAEAPKDPYQDKILVSDSSGAQSLDSDQVRVYVSKIAELEAQIAGLKSTAAAAQYKRSVTGGGITGLLKKAWPFRSRASETPPPFEKPDDRPDDRKDAVDSAANQPQKTNQEEVDTASDTTADPAGQLVKEFQTGGFSRVVRRAQEQSSEIRSELTSQRAQHWVDGVMGEIVSEKARLQELAKQVTLSVRQKEHQFKTRETVLQEELRKKDELLRQREINLTRMKEQLSEMNMTLERSKSAQKGPTDVGHYKHKYSLAQKMLLAAKEENTTLKAKVEDMRSQLLAAQSVSKAAGLPQAELSALRIKHERTARQLDELKRQNRQLSEKLAESKKDRTISGGNIEELKRKLEASTKLVTAQTKEVDQLKLQIEELRREEARLKAELAARGTGQKAASGTGSGSKAA